MIVEIVISIFLMICLLTVLTALSQLPFYQGGRPAAKPGEVFRFDPRYPYVTRGIARAYGFTHDKNGPL
jgi:hypothetical protein